MTDKPLLILIAGPYRSGTDGDPQAMAANLARLEAAAWPVFEAGHIPMIGEWVALPVLRSAGASVTDPLADEVLYPAADRLTGHPGLDVPDQRGRTGLDQAGRGLDRNPGVVVRDVELTSQGWHVLRRTTFDYRRRDGRWESQRRETYDRGNGAVVLPYDVGRGCVLLTRQFRYPAYVNDHPDGMLVEAAAGLLDADDPVTAVRREGAEELGITLGKLTHVLDAYMSPGSVTERLHFFAAPYTPADRTGTGGGLEEDGEDIQVLELPFAEALDMARDGRIVDGKTILLLQWAALDGPFAAARIDQPA